MVESSVRSWQTKSTSPCSRVHRSFEETPEWNVWRQQNPDIRPDLVEARLIEEDLAHADLHQADMRGAVLTAAGLSYADLTSADLRDASLGDANLGFATLVAADLSGADLSGANLFGADLRGACLRGASLGYANISRADLEGADLTEADLKIANTVETKFANAILTGCRVYGISAWGLKLDGATQQNLVITPEGEPEITVDNIEVAQFVYLLLYKQKIRAAIDAITSKAVLILGRFTHERKAVLDALRNELRKRDYLPILFDFDVPATRDITETVTLLARMSRFICRSDRPEQHPEGIGGDRPSACGARSTADRGVIPTLCNVQRLLEV
jgi:uncharacterized protein YjbI with pentapeptide repeats